MRVFPHSFLLGRTHAIRPPFMTNRISYYSKKIVICVGVACVAYSLATASSALFSWGYLLLILFSITIAPRMSLTMPRSRFAISFADALIFLCILLYGGKAAVILTAIETLANCLYLRSKGFPFAKLMIPTNVSISTISTTITFLIYMEVVKLVQAPLDPTRTQHLITIVGLLALSQFFVSTLIVAVFQWMKDGSNVYKTWKRECFSSSMTQIVGAGLAGLVFKLINFGDFMTVVIASMALAIAYLNYRQSISEINRAIEQVEEAEKQKSETERQRRREAEKHASQLSVSLDKEEKANVALRKSERNFQYAAMHDSLTNLANRKQLGDMLRQLIKEYKDDPGVSFHVLFLDIRQLQEHQRQPWTYDRRQGVDDRRKTFCADAHRGRHRGTHRRR